MKISESSFIPEQTIAYVMDFLSRNKNINHIFYFDIFDYTYNIILEDEELAEQLSTEYTRLSNSSGIGIRPFDLYWYSKVDFDSYSKNNEAVHIISKRWN